VPRPAIHKADDVLDAARDLVIEAGPRTVGIRAIGERSGAPSGSLYHRFGSREELLARAWLRAVERFQQGFLRALAAPDPRDAALEAVAWAVEFALASPADTQLLLEHSRLALLQGEPREPIAEALARINDPIVSAVRCLAIDLYGSDAPEAMERVTYAVIDLPIAVLRRHLSAGTLTDRTVPSLQSAVSALLASAENCRPAEAGG
jgi:AcrR family transcriptional regulator